MDFMFLQTENLKIETNPHTVSESRDVCTLLGNSGTTSMIFVLAGVLTTCLTPRLRRAGVKAFAGSAKCIAQRSGEERISFLAISQHCYHRSCSPMGPQEHQSNCS